MISLDIDEIAQLSSDDAMHFMNEVLSYTYKEWFDILSQHFSEKDVTTNTIPQFSDFEVGSFGVVTLVRQLGDYGPTYKQIGVDLLGRGKNAAAYVKYGENHAKLAEQLGLLKTKKNGRSLHVYLSEVGKLFELLEHEKKYQYLLKVVLLIPIIYNVSFSTERKYISKELKNYLAESTALRRSSNVNKIMKLVKSTYGSVVDTEIYVNLR